MFIDRSGTPGRYSPGSTGSLGTLVETPAETPVPIRATHTVLVWGSIRAGKSETKQLTIRNTSNNKLKLCISIRAENQSFKVRLLLIIILQNQCFLLLIVFTYFQFLKDGQTVVSSMSLTLQGMDSKTLFVIFAPNSSQAASGKIIFSHYSSMRDSREISGLVKVVRVHC